MSSLQAIPRNVQREEAWANGVGSTTVVLREPDHANWTLRVSVANVEQDGPFSELPGTRRTLVDTMILPAEPRLRWLVYLHSGRVQVHAGAGESLALNPCDAVLVIPSDTVEPARIEGAGEIVLVKLYA